MRLSHEWLAEGKLTTQTETFWLWVILIACHTDLDAGVNEITAPNSLFYLFFFLLCSCIDLIVFDVVWHVGE